jgi:TolB protein
MSRIFIFLFIALFAPGIIISQDRNDYPSPTQVTKVMDAYPQLSPDGKKILFQSNRLGNWDIFIADPDGTNLHQLTTDSLNEVTPKWSPDGKQIVYCIDVDTVNSDIYIMDADGKNQLQLTTFPGDDSHPNWSPDGEQIVFNSAQNTSDYHAPWGQQFIEIFTMNVDGSGKKQISNLKTVSTYPSFSPDGKYIVFRSVIIQPSLNWDLTASTRNSEIFIMNADGSNVRNLSSNIAYDGWPTWSPDGEFVLFSSNRTGPSNIGQLYIVRKNGSDLKQLTNGPGSFVQATWPKNKRIFAATHWENEDYGFIVSFIVQ